MAGWVGSNPSEAVFRLDSSFFHAAIVRPAIITEFRPYSNSPPPRPNLRANQRKRTVINFGYVASRDAISRPLLSKALSYFLGKDSLIVLLKKVSVECINCKMSGLTNDFRNSISRFVFPPTTMQKQTFVLRARSLAR